MRENWVECTLGEVIEIISGKNQKNVVNKNGKYPIYGSGGVIGRADEYLCMPGTTIIGRKGTINSPIYVREKFWNVDTAFGFYPTEILNNRLLYFFCVFFNFKKLDKSTTIPSLAKRDLFEIKFPLPPLPIQNVMVAKIEELFSSLDSGIADLKKAKDQLKIYRQAVLKKAFEGEFPQKSIIEIADVNTGGTPKRGNSDYWENGTIPWVTSTVVNDEFVSEPSDFITETAIKQTNCKVFPKGSLLMAMYGEGKTRGKCSELAIDAATNQALAAITLFERNKDSKRFLKLFLLKNYEEVRLLSSGGVQPNLNLTIVKNTVIPFPSQKEQNQIVQEIESRLSVCDAVEKNITESLEKAKALRQSILKKAFDGKLLSEEEITACKQHADYEPASVLLEKIKAEKKK